MKVLIIQMNNLIKGIDKRLNVIDRIISKSKDIDLILLPALSTTSYLEDVELIKYLDKENGLAYRFTKDMSSKYNSLFGIGFPEKKGGAIFNSYIIGDEKNINGIIRENNSFSSLFKKGKYNHLIKTKIGNIFVAIGNDLNSINLENNSNIKLIIIPDYKYNINNEEIKGKLYNIYKHVNIPIVYLSNNIKENKEDNYDNANIISILDGNIIESTEDSLEIII